MKLTNESVAKALGWKRSLPRDHARGVWGDAGGLFIACTTPNFTTSLDAIATEIEARGLYWIVARQFEGTDWASIRAKGMATIIEVTDATAPLALCAALLAYLKRNP